MQEIVNRLLIESGFVPNEDIIPFFAMEDKSFFFIVEIAESDFKTLRSKELINLNPQYKAVIDGFKAIVNDGSNISIEKNSSLCVLVKCSKIKAIADLQQQILLFEEDAYFFKKYVILYTDSSIGDLASVPLIPVLRTKVNDKAAFSAFATTGYKPEIEEYLVILQLFIKLPFLGLEYFAEDFLTLDSKIVSNLGSLSGIYDSILLDADAISELDFGNPGDQEKIDDFLITLGND